MCLSVIIISPFIGFQCSLVYLCVYCAFALVFLCLILSVCAFASKCVCAFTSGSVFVDEYMCL